MARRKPAPRKLTLYAVPRLFERSAKERMVYVGFLSRKKEFNEIPVIIADARHYKVVRKKPAKKAKKKGGRKP